MRNNTFTFNGHSSDEFGIKIERFRPLNRPPRKYDAAAVSGRNGNIYKLQDAWEEILVSYEIFAGDQKNGETIAIFANMNPVTFSDIKYSGRTVQELRFFFPKVLYVAPNIISVNINGNETITFPVPMYGGTYDYISGTLTVTSDRDGNDLEEPDVYHLEPHSVVTVSGANTFGIVSPATAKVEIMRIGNAQTLDRQWTNIMEWLHSADGYAELYDTFDADHYRKAVFVDSADIQNSWNHYGRAVVSFHCRPERFLLGYKGYNLDMSQTVQIGIVTSLVSVWDRPSYPAAEIKVLSEGTQFKILDSSGGFYHIVLSDGKTYGYVDQGDNFTVSNAYELFNPTNHIAKPTIWLSVDQYSGTYSLTINTITMTISPSLYGLPETLEIDCDNETFPIRRMNAQATFTDQNGNVSAKFLYLQAGFNWFVVGSGFTAVTLDANFWEI